MGCHHWARGVSSKSRRPDSLEKSTCVRLIGSLQGSWPAIVHSPRGRAKIGLHDKHRENLNDFFNDVYPSHQQRASIASMYRRNDKRLRLL